MPRGGEIVIVVEGTSEFARIAGQLKNAGNGVLLRRMRSRMRVAAQPLLREARRNLLALDSAGARGGGRAARYEYQTGRSRKITEQVKVRAHRQRGLRAAAAAATTIEVNTGGNPRVRLRTNPNKMPADQRKLPWHMNTGRWRHPVMGNRDAWVTQTVTPRGWFGRATQAKGPAVRDGARDALNETIAEIG